MRDLASRIEACGAVKYGTFELSSGAESSYYIDKYVFETHPDVLATIADEVAARLDDSDVDVVAGPALGAVPLATAVSLRTGLRAAFVRKGRKGYGTDERIEGAALDGRRVALVEDVTTSGGTLLETAELVDSIGGQIERVIVVVDRAQGAVERLADAGYDLEHLVQVGTDLDVSGADAG